MKRTALLAIGAAGLLTACDGLREAMTAHVDVVARAGATPDEVDLWLWTQVNRSTIEVVMRTLGQPMSKAHTIMHKWGYTGSACLPMALDGFGPVPADARVLRGESFERGAEEPRRRKLAVPLAESLHRVAVPAE